MIINLRKCEMCNNEQRISSEDDAIFHRFSFGFKTAETDIDEIREIISTEKNTFDFCSFECLESWISKITNGSLFNRGSDGGEEETR